MDEEDGRLGPQARQSGRFDVLMDASTNPLRHQLVPVRWVPHVSLLRRGSDLCSPTDLFQRPNTNEVNHENVPGK
jgi:hypothetical protein